MQNLQLYFAEILSGLGLNDILDILITTFVVYKILEFIKETRAQQLVKGLVVLVVAYFLSGLLNLHVVHWFLGAAFTIGLFALVVLFQPELRRGLEYMGRSKLLQSRMGFRLDSDNANRVTEEITSAIMRFSAEKTGALIVFEREITLEDIAETGTLIDAKISEQMLGNLFYEGSPLHDGAVIIRGGRIYAAGCVLPLTDNKNLNKSLGTRHRAGIGITENSDAFTLIVSEETGIISVAEEGKITRFLDSKNVENLLINLFLEDTGEKKTTPLTKLGDKLGRGKNAR